MLKKLNSIMKAENMMIDSSTHSDLLTIMNAQKDKGTEILAEAVTGCKVEQKEWHVIASSHDEVSM